MLNKSNLKFINNLTDTKFNRYINSKTNNNNILYIHQLYEEYKLYFKIMKLNRNIIEKPKKSYLSNTHFYNFDKWCTNLSLYDYNNEHSKYNIRINGYINNHCDFWTTYLFISWILLRDCNNTKSKLVRYYIYNLYNKYIPLIKDCLPVLMTSIDKSRRISDIPHYFYKKLITIFQKEFNYSKYTFNDFILVIWTSSFILSYFVKYIHNNGINNISKVINKQFIYFKEAISNL